MILKQTLEYLESKGGGDRSDDIRNLSILYEIEVDMNDSKKNAKIAYDALDEKKAEDIRVIDISAFTVVADYFIIANVIAIIRCAHWWIMFRNSCIKRVMK